MKRPHQSTLNNWATLSILIAASACGGGGGGEGQPTASTLAYVVTECRGDAHGATIRQRLQIRRGDQVPMTVVEHSAAIGIVAFGSCRDVGLNRQGPLFAELGVFRRLGVSPDGSQVVFEVTDEATDEFLPTVFPPHTLLPEEKGIFAVRAEGASKPRFLGPASSVGSFYTSFFVFSPNGRTIAYTDRGPSSDDQDAVQIFTLDLATSERRQVTHLPPASGLFGGTYTPFFNDDQRITFFTRANADGNHPGAANIVVTVKTDGTELKVAPSVVALPGSEVLTSFRITGAEVNAAVLTLPGTPVNPGIGNSGNFSIQEVFDIDRDNNVLQLTNFHRVDTFNATVSADGHLVFFSASADPGTNPTENCQIFSIDRTGGDLRQLTDFHEGPEGRVSTNGCSFARKPFGCGSFFAGRDIQSGAVLFYSTCDPFGTNPNGSQLFSIHEDGTGLRQLTNTQGYTRDASGAVIVELPFPFAYPGFLLRNQLLVDSNNPAYSPVSFQ